MSKFDEGESVNFESCDIQFSESFSLQSINLQIRPGEHWIILGANGSGKSALAAALVGEGQLLSGTRHTMQNALLVSFETQAALIDEELARDDSDITNEVFEGTPVRDFFDELPHGSLLQEFSLQDKLDQSFRSLSTGETRKLMLARAISASPQLLVLDEPFDGLDSASAPRLKERLLALTENTQLVLALNRLDEIPEWITHAAYLSEGQLVHSGEWRAEREVITQLLGLQKNHIVVPTPEIGDRVPALEEGPLIRLTNGRIAYGDEVIFHGLNWQVNPGEHWQVVGPNGSGKTCLLNLVTGDHPQCYTNELFVVGYQRGKGESIWDIKQHLGYVSTALQWEYRVSISLVNVILSGFFDSIGLYEKASEQQQNIALQWLDLLGLGRRANEPFNQCSYGEQRMLLIARAMVKHPQLLILDEPCLGLDEVNRRLVLSLIELICSASETTVLYVNHHAEDRISGIDRILNMADYR